MQTDWDLRLACLLLYAFDKQDNFWQLYGDFLPSPDECTSLLLATEVIFQHGSSTCVTGSMAYFTVVVSEISNLEV